MKMSQEQGILVSLEGERELLGVDVHVLDEVSHIAFSLLSVMAVS